MVAKEFKSLLQTQGIRTGVKCPQCGNVGTVRPGLNGIKTCKKCGAMVE